jgi:hypothetical protein
VGSQTGSERFARFICETARRCANVVTALSDKDMSYSYSVIESPLPLAYHSSTVSLLGVEGGAKTLATWYV